VPIPFLIFNRILGIISFACLGNENSLELNY
jgi:hypothetical protein